MRAFSCFLVATFGVVTILTHTVSIIFFVGMRALIDNQDELALPFGVSGLFLLILDERGVRKRQIRCRSIYKIWKVSLFPRSNLGLSKRALNIKGSASEDAVIGVFADLFVSRLVVKRILKDIVPVNVHLF